MEDAEKRDREKESEEARGEEGERWPGGVEVSLVGWLVAWMMGH